MPDVEEQGTQTLPCHRGKKLAWVEELSLVPIS